MGVLRFGLLSSGSNGNALLVVTPQTKILIDNGLSFKQLALRAAAVGETLDDVRAVFVSHEHGDHVRGIGVLARRLEAPVYMTHKTQANLPDSVGRIPRVECFEAGDTMAVDGIALTSYSVSHDAVDPVNFIIRAEGVQLGIATDLGHVSHLVKNRLEGSHALVLESNYCPTMLRDGPYPPALQQRIRGRHGHLSNADMNALLEGLLHDALRIVVLAHLSEKNNAPVHARELAARVLDGHPAALHVADRYHPTPMFEIAE